MKKILVAAVLIVTTASPASAQRGFVSAGQGSTACGKYLEVRENQGDVTSVVGWAWGYMTAYNQWSTYPQVNDVPASSTVLAYLDKHCRENPLDAVIHGVIQLVADLGGFRPPPRKKP